MKDLKQKIFGLYATVPILHHPEQWPDTFIDTLSSMAKGDIDSNLEKCYLLVTPLHMITDEHAIEVAKLCPSFNQTGEYEVYVNGFGQTVVSSSKTDIKYHKLVIKENELNIDQVDCLRKNGYGLRAFGHSVDSLISQGIFKLKEA